MKKQATYGDYIITINDDNSVAVSYQGEECSNAKKALREVSEKVGFDFDAGWTTRQFGSKLVDFLKTNAPQQKTSGPSITITPDTFICQIYEEFYKIYPYIHVRILMADKDMFEPSCDVDPTLTLAECGPEELMNYETREEEGVISLDGSRTINELMEDFNQYGINAYLFHINGESLELERMYSFDRTLADYNDECECCECPAYKVGDEWPHYEEEEDEEDDEDIEKEENDDYLRISPDTVVDDIYIAFTLKYPHMHLRFLSESGVMDSIIDSSKTVAEIRKLYKTKYSTDSGTVSLAEKRTISDFCDELDAYGICRSWVCVHYGDELETEPHGWERTLSFAEEKSTSCAKYMIAGKRTINERGEIIATEEQDDSGVRELSVSDQFAILAYHIANLDDEVRKEELDMIIMAVQNFEEFDGSEVMGRLMQERMGLHLYDVDDVLFAVREEHHVIMFQALAMVSVSDFNFTKEKKNILNVLSKAWDLRADKCNEFLGNLIEQVNEAYPGKLVIE